MLLKQLKQHHILKLPCLDFVGGIFGPLGHKIFVMAQNMQHQGAAGDGKYAVEGQTR